MKKLLSVLLTLALLITLVPGYSVPGASAAEGQPFMFPNEKYDIASARVVTEKNVTLTGTIDRIVGSSISYKVEQITPNSEEPLNSTESITTGIQTTGSGNITVSGVELFPGLNKITFTGVSTTGGNARVSIYIEYRNSPTLHSLEAIFHNRNYAINDSDPTVVFSTSQAPNANNRLVIRGFAPNADRVTISLNGNTYGAFVSSTTGQFSTSELNIAAGINDITLKVENSGQIVEMTRQIVWYDGSVVHYEPTLVKGTGTTAESFPIVHGSDYALSATSGNVSDLKITGKAILPLPLYNPMPVGNTPGVAVDPDNTNDVTAALLNYLKLNLTASGATPVTFSPSAADLQFTVTKPASPTDIGYVTVNYTYELGSLTTDTPYTYTMEAPNTVQVSTSLPIGFTLRDGNKAFIAAVNYLSGYEKDMAPSRLLSLEGTAVPAAGQSVHTLPLGVEVVIANPGSITTTDLSTILSISGLPSGYNYTLLPTNEQKSMIINGKSVPVYRAFIEISQFSKSGSNQLGFKLTHSGAIAETRYVTFNLSFGPYVKFDNIANDIIVKYDTLGNGQNAELLDKLGNFSGQLINVAKPGDIHYKGSASPQTVFLYLNNVEIPISPISATDHTKFKVQYNSTVTIDSVAQAIIKSGENRLKFVYHSASDRYESTWTFTVMPENMPEVPASNGDGVYPYRINQWPPLANDPLFENTGVLYRTEESRLNVYGTFDFIDLGILGTGGSYANIEQKLNSIDETTKKSYIVEISNPNWGDRTVTWDLTKQFKLATSDRTVLKLDNGSDVVLNSTGQNPTTGDARITFYYDVNKQYFFFNIEDQHMPDDGSPLAYVITVYNTGKTGPSVTYRMEVNPISIPYDLISPRVENRVTNKNFVELIIHAAGANSVMVGKEAAEKIAYITENGANEQTVNAFRYVVKDLKPNRDTKISFTITRGETKLTDTITVKYVPTNIPGSQVLETMKASHKVFNNSLTLAFPKNTNLISSQYNNSNIPATRVYSGNEILFGIANPNDGVVERISGETDNSDYTSMVRTAGELYVNYRFQDQAGRYIMASPLYWIDAGLADDPSTASAFDPITTGQDPYPFENYKGKYSKFFTSRLNDISRELVPNNPGNLTLTYDKNIVANANATITVFRLDPITLEWENIGGVVDSKRGTVTVPFTKFGYYVATKLTRGFNDVIDHSYARDAMEAMYAKGIMNAVDAVGIFGGDRYVTRGEFTRMIVRALDIPLNYYGSLHFTYYPETITNASNQKSLYDYRYIETAARAGIVNGTRPGFFDEDVQLTREQASTILARALQLKLETDSTKAKTQLDKAFKDGIERFDNYAIPSVLAIQKKGFIVGKPINTSDPKAGYMFDPKARLLRSDAAIIIARVMNDQKKLPSIYF